MSKSDFQDFIAQTVTACIKHTLPAAGDPVSKPGTASAKEAAKYLGISEGTLRTHTLDGTIKGNRIGRRLVYKWADLDAALTAINTSDGQQKKEVRA